jgi:hypothetical protein
MECIKTAMRKSAAEKSPLVVWLKGGEKIFGRVRTLQDDHIVIDVTGEMSEFQPYNAIILLDQIAAIAWVADRD